MLNILRFIYILYIFLYFNIVDTICKSKNNNIFLFILEKFFKKNIIKINKAKKIRIILESFGPIFIKFGQIISTRKDLVSIDIIQELSLLQDRVKPFSSENVLYCIYKSFGDFPNKIFKEFNIKPAASASIAQVHFAKLLDKRKVAIKILRPGILKSVKNDLFLIKIFAYLIEILNFDLKRLKPINIVNEFDIHLSNELNMIREASNCNQIRRNFQKKNKYNNIIIPKIIWEYTNHNILTMERMYGIPVNQTDKIKSLGINLKKTAKNGIKIFFTQVFSDGFFHADMHPGNIYISNNQNTLGKYIALDFGIVGSLSEFDKNYLAQNFLAFFHRDYRKVAKLHIESGWVPKITNEEDLENSIRVICEPYFYKKLSHLSLGNVLLKLFQTSRMFNVIIQPQLVLLQKTLLNIEGIGSNLDPELNIWKTAKPYLETWMHNRIGIGGLKNKIKKEAINWGKIIPEIPNLLHNNLRNSYETFKHKEQINFNIFKSKKIKFCCKFIFIVMLITFTNSIITS